MPRPATLSKLRLTLKRGQGGGIAAFGLLEPDFSGRTLARTDRAHFGKGESLINYLKNIGFALLFLPGVFWLSGCYPKPVGPPGAQGQRLTWERMNKDQRKAHMAAVVLPQAADLFRSWRPERFAKVDCSLCHGFGAETEVFKMPTGHLPRLSGELLLGPERAAHPETTRLKLERLVPMMSEALGLKSFSIITRTGFGCYSCHLGPSGPMFGN